MLFVDNQQAQVFEFQVVLQKGMGADNNVEPTISHQVDDFCLFFFCFETRDDIDIDWPVGEPVPKSFCMLLGQQGCRYQHRDLLA